MATNNNATTIQTSNGQTYNCTVAFTGSWLTVTSNGSKGKSIRIDLTRQIPPGPAGIILANLLNLRTRFGNVFTRSFSHAECLALASLKAPATFVPTAPTVQPVPSPVVAPVAPPASLSALAPAFSSPAQTVIDHTNGRQVEGVTKRIRRTKKQMQEDRDLPEAAELERLHAAVKTLEGGELVSLSYYIPSSLAKECPNPSWLLWHFGFRFDLSGWFLPRAALETRVIKKLLAHWQQYPCTSLQAADGVECTILRQHPDEAEHIRQIAQSRLEARIREIHTSLINGIDSADKRLQEAQTALQQANEGLQVGDMSREEVLLQTKRDGEIRQSIRNADRDLNAAISCAMIFDETETISDLLNALRNTVRSTRESQNAMFLARGAKTV
jgi:hypothetical protein